MTRKHKVGRISVKTDDELVIVIQNLDLDAITKEIQRHANLVRNAYQLLSFAKIDLLRSERTDDVMKWIDEASALLQQVAKSTKNEE